MPLGSVCIPFEFNVNIANNVNIALWLTFSHQSFQKSVEFGGRRETLFDKYFPNSELLNNLIQYCIGCTLKIVK